jgi:hypothetical protein
MNLYAVGSFGVAGDESMTIRESPRPRTKLLERGVNFVGKISRVSKSDFNRVLGETRMLEANKAIAFAVLVDGKAQSAVAEETGQSRSNIQRIVEQARGYLEAAMQDGSSAWIRTDVDMPKSMVDAWANLSTELAKCKSQKVSQPIIEGILSAIERGSKTLKSGKKG